MILDIPTLLVVSALFHMLMALLMLQYRHHRKVYAGFELWTLSALAIVVAHVAWLSRPFIPVWWSVLGGSVGACLGTVLRWDGVMRFVGRGPIHRAWYGLPLLVGGTMTVMTWMGMEAPYRNLVLSPVMAAIAVTYSIPLLGVLGEGRTLGVTAAACSILEAIALVSRAAAWLTEAQTGMFDPTAFQAAYFNLAMLCEVAISAIFMLMNSQRLEEEITKTMARLATTLEGLQETRDGLKILSGLLSICAQCKKVRATEERWERVEVYLSRHSDVQFSHGLCHDCLEIHYGPPQDDDIEG